MRYQSLNTVLRRTTAIAITSPTNKTMMENVVIVSRPVYRRTPFRRRYTASATQSATNAATKTMENVVIAFIREHAGN
jgi:hypothetical protein